MNERAIKPTPLGRSPRRAGRITITKDLPSGTWVIRDCRTSLEMHTYWRFTCASALRKASELVEGNP